MHALPCNALDLACTSLTVPFGAYRLTRVHFAKDVMQPCHVPTLLMMAGIYFTGILGALLWLSAGICFTRQACRDGTEGSDSHANLTSKGCQQNEAVSQQPQHAFNFVQAHKVQYCRGPRSNSCPTRSRVYTTGSSEYTAYTTICS